MANKIWISLMFLFAAPVATAAENNGVALNINLLYATLEHKDNEPSSADPTRNTDEKTTTKDTYTFYTVTICKFFTSICVGARYLSNSLVIDSKSTGGQSPSSFKISNVWNGIGLDLGFMSGGFFGNFAFYFKNDLTQKATFSSSLGSESDKAVYDGGTAYSLDLGYGFAASNSVKIGPQFSYTHFDYEKVKDKDGKRSLDFQMEDNHLVPQIALWWMF